MDAVFSDHANGNSVPFVLLIVWRTLHKNPLGVGGKEVLTPWG